MKFIKKFEAQEEPQKSEATENQADVVKKCEPDCERMFYLKDGKPVVYCPNCDRILNN